MSAPFKVVQQDLSGGLNYSDNPSALALNESLWMVNFFAVGKRLRKRPGRTTLNVGAPGSVITGLYALKTSVGTWTVLVGQPTGISALVGGALVPLASSDGSVYPADTVNPWRMREYLDTVYAVRKNTGRVKAVLSSSFCNAGILAPTVAPTLAQGPSNGRLDPGAYIGTYTYGISSTGAESNESPQSAALGLAQGKEIDWAVTPPTDPRVDTIYLYRTTAGGAQRYRVTALPLGTYTYVDTVITALLGQSVSLRNGIPPALAHLIEVYAEALWLSDGVNLWNSEPGQPESFFGTANVQVSPDDGHEIRALCNWSRGGSQILVVGKTNAIYVVTGSTRADFRVDKLTDQCGVIAADSMKAADGRLFWFDGANVYMSTGGQPKNITDPKITTLLSTVPAAYLDRVVAAVYPQYSQYRLSVPVLGAATPNVELTYDYDIDAWLPFQYPGGGGTAPQCYGQMANSSFSPLIYAAMNSDGLVYDITPGVASSDDGVAISGSFQSKRITAEKQEGRGTDIAMRQLTLHCPDSPRGSATLDLFLDSDAAPYRTRSITINTGKDFKPFWLSSIHRRASSLSWRITHSGTDDFELWGAIIEGIVRDRDATRRA